MKTETRSNLQDARKSLGNCAKKVSARQTTTRSLSATEKETIIGFGTARDWVRWAVALEDLSFSTKGEKKSARAQGITESVRFNQLWTATNSLFAKDPILTLACLPHPLSESVKKSEINRFEALYKFADIDRHLEHRCLTNLNSLLSMECQTDDVTGHLNADGTPTMWEVVYQKYMRPEDRKRSLGKVIGTSIENAKKAIAKLKKADRRDQPLPTADGPMLIYAARNWAVHGMLLTSFFRGSRQKYITFIDNVILLLSLVLQSAARNFHSIL